MKIKEVKKSSVFWNITSYFPTEVTALYDVIFQNTELSLSAATRTSNPTKEVISTECRHYHAPFINVTGQSDST